MSTSCIIEPQVSRAIGASVSPNGVIYRVWAPDHASLSVRVARPGGEAEIHPMERDAEGYFMTIDADGAAGDRYQFQFADGRLVPDVASRFQPEGVHGPSECIDPHAYSWVCTNWRRPAWRGQVIYELHIGTFTPAGTFRAAIEKLDHVVALGAQAIEIMPVADFPGERNWGYDGVALYAPARCYGRPDDLRALVDAAHQRGLAVILDVVYNHVGPDGNYLEAFSSRYFHSTKRNPWGRAFNLDAADAQPVRDYFLRNVAYWLDEFRIDGLRLDATHAIEDASTPHLLTEIGEVVRARGAFAIAEDERNAVKLLDRDTGHRLHGVWADDFHHQVRVALTGIRESYFGSYEGTAQALASTLQQGWTYVGQPFPFWQDRPRGSSCQHLPPHAFVYCIENHDQIGNRAQGERLEHLVSPARFRAASALLCLSPYAPLLFMGQEWAASTPFIFFTDHGGEIGKNVSAGRRREFQETGLNAGGACEVPDPQLEATFLASKLRWDELQAPPHATTFALYRALLAERAEADFTVYPFRQYGSVQAIGNHLVLRFRVAETSERLLIVSLHEGAASTLDLASAAILRPARDFVWEVRLHTEETRFGGEKKIALETTAANHPSAVRLEGPGAVLFASIPRPCGSPD